MELRAGCSSNSRRPSGSCRRRGAARVMSEVVCQVSNQASAVEFIWSARGGFFRPYAVSGTQLTELRQAADQTRGALETLVFTLNDAGAGPATWEPSFELEEAG